MAFDAPHIGFVLAAYGLSAVVMLVLVVGHVVWSRRQDRRVAELEAAGAPRRPGAGKAVP